VLGSPGKIAPVFLLGWEMAFHTIVGKQNLYEAKSLDEVIEYLNHPANFLNFSDSVRRLIERERSDAHALRKSELVRILFSKLDAAGAAYHPDTVRHWINRDVRPGEDLAIALCFAFDHFRGDPDAANTFLMKDCLLDGFSPREPRHILYYYSLANSYAWSEAEKLHGKYAKMAAGIEPVDSPEDPEDNGEDTIVLIDDFFSEEATRKDEDSFVGLLLTYYSNGRFGRYRKTALEHYNDLLAGLIAGIEGDYVVDNGCELTIPYARLLIKLFPRPRQEGSGEPVRYSQLMLPKEVTKKLPNEPDLPRMERGEIPVTRKALILAHFASFWIFEDTAARTDRQNLDRFQTKTNEILGQCGMLELYPGNPFDWMVMKSVLCNSPVDYLDDLIDMAYVRKAEEAGQD
jgi:hypothetical protein